MSAIGGYFELADFEEEGRFPHQDGILLNTGRNALEYILRCIGDVRHIFLPYYTCEVVLEPIKKLGLQFSYYHINSQFEIVDDIQPQKGEYLIANNYFGIKDAYIKQLAERYGSHLIVDCAQAFFAEPIRGIKTFYSSRKYVGVADGGVAYLGDLTDGEVEVNEVERSEEHDGHLLKRKYFGAEAGFADYQANEKKLDNQPIRWMSDTTKQMLYHINYDKVVAKRKENFQFLQHSLSGFNLLSLPDLDTFSCPMVYPLMLEPNNDIREKLIENKIFVAKYWPNVRMCLNFELEYSLSKGVLPIPCDQRYGIIEMQRILKTIL